jgi:integrase
MYGDGGNLWLSVTNDGAGKSWVFRWTVPGTRRERVMGLGPIHTVDLEEAREKAREYRKLLMAGKDPLEERDGARLDQDIARGLAKTVSQVLDEYFDAKIARKSEHLIKTFQYCVRNPVCDKIGDMPIQKVNTDIILKTLGLQQMWTEKHEAAKSLQSRLKLIFKFAKAKGYYRGDNPAEWKDHLENVLPASKEVHKVTHHAALPYKDVGRFMAKLRAWEDGSNRQHGHTASALMLEFIVLTGVRVSEARLATWQEFDLRPEPDGMIWNVPPENRKTGHLHDEVRPIPITPPMLAVLEEMQRRRTDQDPKALVFQSPHGGEYDVNACWQLITKTLKWDPPITAHGFRTTLTHWCNANGFAPRLINRQLDHVVGGKVLRAYDRDPSIEERRAMMRLWGDYCARPAPEPATGTVVEMNGRRKNA